MDVQIKNCEPLRLVGIRHTGAYMGIGKAFERIAAYAGRHRLFGPGTRMVGVYHDDPMSTAESDLRSDACVTLSGDHEPSEGAHLLELEAGQYACAVHEGHYSTLGDTYRAIMSWIESEGKQMAPRVSYEVYLNTPMDTKPEDLRTEVRVPVA